MQEQREELTTLPTPSCKRIDSTGLESLLRFSAHLCARPEEGEKHNRKRMRSDSWDYA